MSVLGKILDVLSRATGSKTRPSQPARPRQPARPKEQPATTAAPLISYEPAKDGNADPGEVVWTWVAYEEDATQGKDRPALIIGRMGREVVGLMLTTKEHGGPDYLSIGRGPWDKKGRPSWIRLDRVLRLDPDAIRREGAVLERQRFDQVIAAFRAAS